MIVSDPNISSALFVGETVARIMATRVVGWGWSATLRA